MKPAINLDKTVLAFFILGPLLFLMFMFRVSTAQAPNPIVLERLIHAFYYMWYGNPTVDGTWIHWNAKDRLPPDDLASNYYPLLGPYSSRDARVMRYHLQWMRDAGIGTAIISYWGPFGPDFDVLDEFSYWSLRYGIRWAFLIEPYRGITRNSLERDLQVLLSRYHSVLFRVIRPTPDFPWKLPRPVFYLFNMGMFHHEDWIQLMRKFHHRQNGIFFVINDITGTLAGWGTPDGFYSYTPAPAELNFTYHPQLKKAVTRDGFAFVATVSPGFETRRYRSDLAFLETPRQAGRLYDRSWQLAIQLEPDWIAIISFNEWHEGTQIEPAVTVNMMDYQNYEGHFNYTGSGAPYAYILRTKSWVETWIQHRLGENER